MSNIVSHLGKDYDWICFKHGHNQFTVTITLSAAAYDISTYVFSLAVKKHGSSTAELTLTEGSGLTNGGATGILTIDLTAAQAGTTLPGDNYFYELTYVKSAKTYAFIQGGLTLSAQGNPGTTTTSLSVSVSLAGTALTAAITLNNTVTSAEVLTAFGAQTATHFLGGPTPAFRAIADADIPAALARLASPTFTGTPTLPTGTISTTQTAGDNSTKVASTAFVTAAVAAGGGGTETKTFDPALLFDISYDMTFVQTGAITLSADLTGAKIGTRNYLRVTPNGDGINIPTESPTGTDWEVLGTVSATAVNHIWIEYTALGRILVNVVTGFALADISTLVEWWDATKLSKFTLTGSLVDAWAGEKSSIALAGSGAERPTRNATGGQQAAGVVEFTGAHALIQDTLATHFTGTDADFTMMVKVRPRNLTTANGGIWSNGRSTNNNPNLWLNLVNDIPAYRREDDTAVTGSQNFPLALSNTTDYVWLTVRFTGTTVFLYKNRTASSELTSNVGAITLDRFAIGCLRRMANSLYGNVDVEKIALFSNSITVSELIKVFNYFNVPY